MNRSMPMPAAPILVLGFLITIYIATAICNEINHNGHVVGCRDSEKQALLGFKQGLEDPSNRLSSWNIKEDNCCNWAGVVCHNLTGHVIELHLQNPYYYGKDLRGEINPSLLNLKHLSYLNLSYNYFGSASIPSFIGSLASLQYLDLSSSGFGGTIPPQLGNLTSLRFLSLHDLYKMDVENLDWLPGLSHLEHLDLADVNLTMASIPSFIGSLASLQYLDLSYSRFGGKIPPQLGNLTSLRFLSLYGLYHLDVQNLDWLPGLSHLEHLDLSRVNLTMAPNWVEVINKLPFLVELHLSYCELDSIYNNIHGVVNFTSLAVLDLSHNNFDDFRIPNWIFSLSRLVSLDLSWCGFLGWPQGSREHEFEGLLPAVFQNVTRLRHLDISFNEIEGRLPSLLGGNLCNLTFMDLSCNKFHGELFVGSSKCPINALESLNLFGNQLCGHIPDQLEQFKNLQYLQLGDNLLSGPIPMDLGKLTSLEFLDLSGNQLNGTLPESLGKLTSLEKLYLNGNQLNGTLPESFGNLSKLQDLRINDNLLEGIVISEVHFANLTNLVALDASQNRDLELKVSPNWVPPFQLLDVKLASWHLGPEFPAWIQSQKQLAYVDLSSCGIVDGIPTWFWNLTSSLRYLNLSHNQIHGGFPYIPAPPQGLSVYLGSNQLNGSLPRISPNLMALDLSNNSFYGNILHFLCDRKDEQKGLFYLNVENNLLSGEIPDCWMNLGGLKVIVMGNNHLTGNIPSSSFRLPYLESLHLRNNHLSGEISSPLQNCTNLAMVDLSENELTGNIPTWIGERLPNLRALFLRSNKLDGPIPPQLCGLSWLQVLDLADNNLSGPIPWCINKFTAMAKSGGMGYSSILFSEFRNSGEVFEHAYLMTKGNMYKYDKILNLVNSIDLSNNNISGEIPEELTSLIGMISLNLSRNNLIGMIPKKMGNMKSLGSLDLSINQLEGEIPSSIAGLSSLGYLNFSYNKLSGKIPQDPQLQSFNATSFIGNKLCGRPLANDCNVDGENPDEGNEGDNEGARFDIDWFYLLMALGFAIGFWGTSGPILFIKSWRYTYFRFLDNVWTRVCVYVQVNVWRL